MVRGMGARGEDMTSPYPYPTWLTVTAAHHMPRGALRNLFPFLPSSTRYITNPNTHTVTRYTNDSTQKLCKMI